MNKDERIVKLKLDVIFKRVFGNENNKDIIAAFLSALLEIPREDIRKVYINNVELAPEYFNQKFSRLDLKLDVDGKIVNIEMQVNYEVNFADRTLFYWSKMFSNELSTGDLYGELKQTICINIINFNLFDHDDYHSHYKIMESSRHDVLTDKFAIHFFELKKINRSRRKKPVEDWLDLINAETEADLMAIMQSTNIPEVRDTIVLLKELSADEKVRQEAFAREMRLHDEANAILGARREGRAEGMKEGLNKGRAEGMKEGLNKGRVEGKADAFKAVLESMRSNGFTEEQIKKALGDNYKAD